MLQMSSGWTRTSTSSWTKWSPHSSQCRSSHSHAGTPNSDSTCVSKFADKKLAVQCVLISPICTCMYIEVNLGVHTKNLLQATFNFTLTLQFWIWLIISSGLHQQLIRLTSWVHIHQGLILVPNKLEPQPLPPLNGLPILHNVCPRSCSSGLCNCPGWTPRRTDRIQRWCPLYKSALVRPHESRPAGGPGACSLPKCLRPRHSWKLLHTAH